MRDRRGGAAHAGNGPPSSGRTVPSPPSERPTPPGRPPCRPLGAVLRNARPDAIQAPTVPGSKHYMVQTLKQLEVVFRPPFTGTRGTQRREHVVTTSLDRASKSCQGVGGGPCTGSARTAFAPGGLVGTAPVSWQGEAPAPPLEPTVGPGLGLHLGRHVGTDLTLRVGPCQTVVPPTSSGDRCDVADVCDLGADANSGDDGGTPRGELIDASPTSDVCSIGDAPTRASAAKHPSRQSCLGTEERSGPGACSYRAAHHGRHDGEREPERAHREP
jgi:hypothetical protein